MSRDVDVYNLNTIGATQMVTRDGNELVNFDDNLSVYVNGVALFKSN